MQDARTLPPLSATELKGNKRAETSCGVATTVEESIHLHVVLEPPMNENNSEHGQMVSAIPPKSVAASNVIQKDPPLSAYILDSIRGADSGVDFSTI